MISRRSALRTLTVTVAAAASVAGAAGFTAPVHAGEQGQGPAPHGNGGMNVYVQSNAADGNAVLAFRSDGSEIGAFATGGSGSGAGLGSQGAVTASADGDHLFAVNQGSATVSAFAVRPDGRLRLLDSAETGENPVSVATRGSGVYVVGGDTVTAFRLLGDRLATRGSRPLSSQGSNPAQIGVVPGGRALIVTERNTNTIDVLPLDAFGRPGPATATAATGVTPFGFAFGRGGVAVVSNASAGEAGGSTVTGYEVEHNRVRNTTPAIPTGQSAACWVAVDETGRYAYVANAGSGTMSSLAVQPDGSLKLIDGAAATPGGAPIDAEVGGSVLWVLDSSQGHVSAIPLKDGGSLGSPVVPISGLPASTSGLAVIR